jgi:hypothetical protein
LPNLHFQLTRRPSCLFKQPEEGASRNESTMIVGKRPMLTFPAGRRRLQAVKLLSSAAYTVLETRGHIKLGLRLSFYEARLKGLFIQIRAPFFVETDLYSQRKYFDELRANPTSVPFHLNIWAPKKVLHVRQYGADIGIVSFDRGGWEGTLLDTARVVDCELEISPMVLPMASAAQH